MNRPCQIHFYFDAAPHIDQLPERYQSNATLLGENGEVISLAVQNAFLIDFVPQLVRTRVSGNKEEDPVDFPLTSINFIEWYYGNDVPEPLVAEPYNSKNG